MMTEMDINSSSTVSSASGNLPGTNYLVLGGVMNLLCLNSLVVNFLTCYVIHKSRRLQSTTNNFIVALGYTALAESLLCSLLTVALFMPDASWGLGNIPCKGVAWLLQTCLNVDIFILTAIAFDRFYTIIYPLSFKITRGRAKRLIAISTIMAMLVAAPNLYIYSEHAYQPQSQEMVCMMQVNELVPRVLALTYHILLTLIAYGVPGALILIYYIRISRFVWRFTSPASCHPFFLCLRFQRTANMVPRAKIKVLKILLLTTGLDLGMAAVYYGMQLYHTQKIHKFMFLSTGYCVFFMGAVKPYIFLALNSNFRRGCREVLCWHTLHSYRQEVYSITTVSRVGKKNYIGFLPPPRTTPANPAPGASYGFWPRGGNSFAASPPGSGTQVQTSGVCRAVLARVMSGGSTTDKGTKEHQRRPSIVFNRALAVNADAFPV